MVSVLSRYCDSLVYLGLLGSTQLESTGVYLGQFGSSWVNLGLLGSTWVYLGLLGSTWVYLGLPGSTWVYLGLLGSTWVYLGLLGSTWVYLDLIEWYRLLKAISGWMDGWMDGSPDGPRYRAPTVLITFSGYKIEAPSKHRQEQEQLILSTSHARPIWSQV